MKITMYLVVHVQFMIRTWGILLNGLFSTEFPSPSKTTSFVYFCQLIPPQFFLIQQDLPKKNAQEEKDDTNAEDQSAAE